MAKKADGNAGCGLIALCVLIILAVGKCGGGDDGQPDAHSSSEAPGISSAATTPMYVTTATLNCRAAPEAGGRIVEKLARGDPVAAGEVRGTWVILDRVGDDCWVAQRFLSESEPEREPAPASRPTRFYAPSSNGMGALSPRRSSGGGNCGSKRTCGQMDSCAEAYHFLNACGLGRLDRDGDGVPCESIC